jgi:cyclic lactone autoinducer peptide
LNQSWLNGVPTNKVLITSNTQTANAVFAWGGDLNWSHSTDPAVVAQNIANNTNVTNSLNKTSFGISSMAVNSTSNVGLYQTKEYEKATLSVSSKLEGGKVVLTTNLTKADLAGLEVILQYDETKLSLDNIVFDAGSTITNFSTNKDGRLTFGSIDQLKTARIKTGTPYKLIFTPKTNLTNTAGLFYFVLSDAVDAAGNKIDLIVE